MTIDIKNGSFKASILESCKHPYQEKTREKILKSLQYLGPWCPNCGIRGNKCEGKRENSCKERRKKQVIKTLNRPSLTSLGAYDWRSRDNLERRLYEEAMRDGL